jgi:hypothetical protein
MPSPSDQDVGAISRRIDETRLTYPKTEHGIRIKGAPFLVEFHEEVDPAVFCDEISTPDEPWHLFGVGHEIRNGYRSLATVLFHVEEGELVGATEADLEVCSDWVRIYVKGEDADAERVAEFVDSILNEFGGKVVFPDVE